ncbi:LysR family transcriptional regulator [Paracoccus sp. (in: a-proteobacteria)]|uniref:LysR family transcriptional regulator n=1 Tax=Paracoccus sp. TaxID=267 RepID=UPI003A86CAF3
MQGFSRVRMRHFRVFLALCDHKSLTRAAQALGTVQPALSRTLKEIEEELGQTLFERTSNGLLLTDAGDALHQHLQAGFAQIEYGLQIAAGRRHAETVKIGMLPNVARTIIPRAVARFKQRSPAVTVHLQQGSAVDLCRMMRSNELDFITSRQLLIEDQPDFIFEYLYSEPTVMIVRAGHPLEGQVDISPHDLDRHTVILPPIGTSIRNELDRYLFRLGHGTFANRIETISVGFIKRYLSGMDAVAYLPLGSAREWLAQGTVSRLDMRGGDVIGAVGLSFLRGHKLSGEAAILAQYLREAAASQD